MKRIKDNVYESLTPEQRVIAAVEAMARDDEQEIIRLKDTCPRYNYMITDPAYSETMQEIMAIAVAIQCDKRDALIITLLAHATCHDESLGIGLQKLSNIDALWTKYLDSKGIDRQTMDKVTKDLDREYLDLFLKTCPDPDIDTVNDMFEDWKRYIS